MTIMRTDNGSRSGKVKGVDRDCERGEEETRRKKREREREREERRRSAWHEHARERGETRGMAPMK